MELSDLKMNYFDFGFVYINYYYLYYHNCYNYYMCNNYYFYLNHYFVM